MDVAVFGNTGAGKTTFIGEMMKRFNTDGASLPVYAKKYGTIEDKYDPELLRGFYSDPFNQSFKMELWKLLQAINDIATVGHGRVAENILFDRSFLDISVFTESLNNMGMLGKPEFNENDYPILRKYLDVTFELFLDKIDLVVFLRNDFNGLVNNINKRGREQEVFNDDLYGLGLQLNVEADKLVDKLREKKAKVITFNNLSKNPVESDEYIKALEIVNSIVDLM